MVVYFSTMVAVKPFISSVSRQGRRVSKKSSSIIIINILCRMSHFGTEKAPLRFACEKAPLYLACDNQTLCFLRFGEMLEIIKYTYHMYYMWMQTRMMTKHQV